MLVIVRLPDGTLTRFEFGPPRQPETTPEERVRAILADYRRRDELIDVGFTPGVAILSSILENAGDRPEDIINPIRALGFMGRPYGAAAVGKHSHHPDLAVRLAVIRTLGQMGKFDSLPNVEPFLQSSVPGERREAIIALGKFSKEDLLPAIDAAAGTGTELVELAQQARARVHATKHGIDTRDYRPLVDVLIGTAEYEDLLPLLLVLWKPLKALLADLSQPTLHRERALRLLAIGRPREIIPEMRKILVDPAEPLPVRLRAVYGLGRARSRSSIDLLADRLQSTEPGMPLVCAFALGQIGDPAAFEPLINAWQAAGPALRERILTAVTLLSAPPPATWPAAETGDFFAFPGDAELIRQFRLDQFKDAVTSSSAAARLNAYILLSLFGGQTAVPILKHAAQSDPDPNNRDIASKGVARVTAAGPGSNP